MTKTVEPPPAGEEGSSSEGEPSRTCADISIEDGRWVSVSGFAELIPDLVADTLLTVRLAPETHTVSIALLSDAEIRALNKAFRGKDAATNVLSFSPAPASQIVRNLTGPVFLGDVALAYETVVREASDQQKPVLHHAAHLVVHGVLHLAGLDHDGESDAERMEAAERDILSHSGIPDPYGDVGLPLATAPISQHCNS
ncbi:MAG: rRNA maturation RNase YbeY [Rhodomicrobium sp.]|nr:rRNA maturation RNase YbeY [Rhodomicrobium sp.]